MKYKTRYKSEAEARAAGEEALKLMQRGRWAVAVYPAGSKSYRFRLVSDTGVIDVSFSRNCWLGRISLSDPFTIPGASSSPWDAAVEVVKIYLQMTKEQVAELVERSERVRGAIGLIKTNNESQIEKCT